MKYILKHKGNDQPDFKAMTDILHLHHVQILDGSLMPQIALVELDESALDLVKKGLDTEWDIYPEKIYPVPSTEKTVE